MTNVKPKTLYSGRGTIITGTITVISFSVPKEFFICQFLKFFKTIILKIVTANNPKFWRFKIIFFTKLHGGDILKISIKVRNIWHYFFSKPS